MSRRRRRAFGPVFAAAALGAALLAGCGGTEGSFDPGGPCVADGRASGAYPELERLLPGRLGDIPPTKVDSGRSCTSGALGTYASHDVAELRFAGATWDLGGGDATVVAALATPTDEPVLHQDWVEEFYRAGAHASGKTENITEARPSIDGTVVYRLETINDLSLQTVLVWSVNDQGLMHVAIVATRVQPGASRDEHDARVTAALIAAKTAPG